MVIEAPSVNCDHVLYEGKCDNELGDANMSPEEFTQQQPKWLLFEHDFEPRKARTLPQRIGKRYSGEGE